MLLFDLDPFFGKWNYGFMNSFKNKKFDSLENMLAKDI